MALLVTYDNQPIFVTAEQGRLLWLVKTGERRGTPITRRKVKKIDKWYLNKATAPMSYLMANPIVIHPTEYHKLVEQPRLPYRD